MHLYISSANFGVNSKHIQNIIYTSNKITQFKLYFNDLRLFWKPYCATFRKKIKNGEAIKPHRSI